MTTAHHGVRYAVITVGTSEETERRVTAPSDSGVSVVFDGLSQFFPVPLDRQTVSFQCQLACEEKVLWAVPMIEWGVPDPGDPESTLVVGTETVGPPLSFGQVTGDAAWAQMDFTYPVASNATLWRPRLMLYALDPTIDHDTIPGATYVSRPMAVQQDIDTLEPITFAAPADFPHGDNDIATFDISAYPNPEGWSIAIYFTAEGAHASTGDSSGATDVGTEYPDFSTDGTVSQTLNVIYSSAAPVDFVAQQGDGGQITISGAAAGDHLTAVGGPDLDAFTVFATLFVNGAGEQIQTDATIYEWWVETTIGGSEPNFRPPDGTEILIDCIYVPENGLSVADQPYLDGDQPYGIWEGEPHASTSLLGIKVPGPDAFDPTVVLPDSLII